MGYEIFGLLYVLRSWLGFMEECELAEKLDEELAIERHLETLNEDELRKLLND